MDSKTQEQIAALVRELPEIERMQTEKQKYYLQGCELAGHLLLHVPAIIFLVKEWEMKCGWFIKKPSSAFMYSSCGERFQFLGGKPDSFKHCPNCGKQIETK